jgi:hypothetical protein
LGILTGAHIIDEYWLYRMNVKSHRVIFVCLLLLFLGSFRVSAQFSNWRQEMDTVKGKPQQVNWIFTTVYFQDRYKEDQLKMLDEALGMAKELNNDSLLGKVYLGIGGYYYYSTTNSQSAFPYLQRSKIYFLKSRSYNITGWCKPIMTEPQLQARSLS